MAVLHSSIRRSVAAWLRQGMTPRRLAFTLALGIAIGCIPMVGVPTLLCAGLAILLRLNLPAIQAANYAAMPLQLLLIFPFVRLGEKLFAPGSEKILPAAGLLPLAPLAAHFASLALHALLAWLVVAGPAVAIMTLAFTLVLRQVPALAAAEASD